MTMTSGIVTIIFVVVANGFRAPLHTSVNSKRESRHRASVDIEYDHLHLYVDVLKPLNYYKEVESRLNNFAAVDTARFAFFFVESSKL
jgi:hypothetical protein